MSKKLLKFLILFDNTSLLYFPGQFLSGRVLIELQEDTPALGMSFCCHYVTLTVGCKLFTFPVITYQMTNFNDIP